MIHDLDTGIAYGAVLVGYCGKVPSDLNYMNNTHPNNYLYMNINAWIGYYKIAVL